MKDDKAVYSENLKQQIRMIKTLPFRLFLLGQKLTRKRSCCHIPWNKGGEIGWLLELQNLECDSSSTLDIYSVTNRKPMQIRKNRHLYVTKTRFCGRK